MDAILAQHPNLSIFGLDPTDEKNPDRRFTEARIEMIRKVIRVAVKPVSPHSKKRIGSYGGKHVIERLIDLYITNGEFILAMLMEGYPMKQIVYGRDFGIYYNRPTPNGAFKADWVMNHGLSEGWRNAPPEHIPRRYKKDYDNWRRVKEGIHDVLFEIVGADRRDPQKKLIDQVAEILGRM
jgi:hypothetical protein